MRLLKIKRDGFYQLTNDLPEDMIPDYAALSHTWLPGDQDVTFKDMDNRAARKKSAGFKKIRFCGERTLADKLHYFWVDSCCINKDSSAELQEALTSMFQWYRNAKKCYAYLVDVPVLGTDRTDMNRPATSVPWESAFRNSRWFKRGWTLQELLAPRNVEFYSVEGVYLGDKRSLESWIHEITDIPLGALRGAPLTSFTIQERLSWSKHRQTQRLEDRAYCLFGIFHVFMPLIYGEGDNAFLRLQAEIGKKNTDNVALDRYLLKLPVASEAAFNSYKNQAEPTCLEKTRTDLRNETMAWARSGDERSIYWLNGIAGTGKSTIARTIARECNDLGILGGSFFFTKGGGDLGNATRLVTSLAHQLATKVPGARRSICEAIRDHDDTLSQSIQDQWAQLILGPLSELDHTSSTFQTVVFVIDALDECESESEIRLILRALSTPSNLNNVQLRVFVTSRPEVPIRHSVSKIPEKGRMVFLLHEISPDVVDRDLGCFFQSNFSILREERGFEPDDWPGPRIIDRLVDISCGLFIWASIACRFIRAGKQMAEGRIKTLIHGHRDGAGPEQQLDRIYTTVLRNATSGGYSVSEKTQLYAMLKSVLGTIVILESPLSITSLATLLHKPSGEVKRGLDDLHTIFHIPDHDEDPIRLHHPTFRDFLLDRNRCSDPDFWVDTRDAHKALADNCLDLMFTGLRKDMCGLVYPGASLSEVKPSRIRQCMPPALQYACLHWVQHYRHSGYTFCDDDRADQFFRKHFLHWLEVMNLMGKSAEMGAIIRLYHALLNPAINVAQIPFVKYARRFMFSFQSILKDYPLQIYTSGLAFIPSSNQLRNNFRNEMHSCIQEARIAEAVLPYTKDEFNYVNDMSFSPDGSQIASGSQIMAARLWDVATGAARHKYIGPKDKISSVSISPDGTLLAGGSDDFTVWIWDLKTREVKFCLKQAHAGWVNSVVFSPEGRWLASGSMDETVAIWDVATGQEVKRFANQSSCVNYASFSPDGSMITTGSVDQMVRLWDVSQDTPRLQTMFDGHFGPVNTVRVSPDGRQIVSGADDMTIKLWDIAKEAEVMTLKGHMKKVMTVIFSPDARYIISGSEDMTVRVWDAVLGSELHILTDHTSGLNSVVFSANGKYLASCSFDDEVRLWDAETWMLLRRFENFKDDADHVVRPSSDVLQPLTVGLDDMMDIDSNEPFSTTIEVAEGHSGEVTSVTFSPDGQFIATGSQSSTIKIWRKEGIELWKLSGHSGAINHLDFSPDGRQLASASTDTTVRVWNTATGASFPALQGHSDNVLVARFSPDGQLLASCSADHSIRLWNTATWAQMTELKGHAGVVHDVVFSPDNRLVASCSADTNIILWDTSNGTQFRTLTSHSSNVTSIAFSTDGNILVSCSEGLRDFTKSSVRLWTGLGEMFAILHDGGLPYSSAAISPDNKIVASCSGDETCIRLWSAETQKLQVAFEVGVAVRKVSFSNCGRYILTDRGVLDAQSILSPQLVPMSQRPHTLFVTHDWIKRGTENVVWLPKDFQATCVRLKGCWTVLGHLSGAVSFISI